MRYARYGGPCGIGGKVKVGGVTHTDVAAYVLGVLDETENTVFEAHLLECPHCQFDLLEFYDLPEILDEIRQYWPAPPMPAPHELGKLLDEVAGARCRRRLLVRMAAAAAALIIVVGPLVAMVLVPSRTVEGSASPQAAVSTEIPWGSGASTAAGDPISGTEPGSPVQATVFVHGTNLGSDITLELVGVTGPRRCQLFAISWTGEAQAVTGWTVPGGNGAAGSIPQTLRVSGSTGFVPDQIQKFEVRADDGTVLASVKH